MSKLRYAVLSRGAKRSSSTVCNNCTPVKWSKYYQKQEYVHIEENSFNIYTAGSNGPVLLLIHGGGYSALTWSLFVEEITKKIECQIVAVDLRGHGSTKTIADEMLSLNVLTEDISSIINTLYGGHLPPIVIIGHSLGGAVAVAVAPHIKSAVGLCVIDVVEGSALESLSSMQSILRGRPSGFQTIEQAIQWSFRVGQTHNLEAARVSMPGQIKSLVTGNLAATEDDTTYENGCSSSEKRPHFTKLISHITLDSFMEEKEQKLDETSVCERINDLPPLDRKPPIKPSIHSSGFKVPEAVENNIYTWRIDLTKTEPFWNGWFKGLSQKFLDVPLPKVLLLANINGLDTALTVGQMQGKFQFQVLPKSGHAIHEDQPQHVADIIAGFLVKHKIAIAKKGFTYVMPAC